MRVDSASLSLDPSCHASVPLVIIPPPNAISSTSWVGVRILHDRASSPILEDRQLKEIVACPPGATTVFGKDGDICADSPVPDNSHPIAKEAAAVPEFAITASMFTDSPIEASLILTPSSSRGVIDSHPISGVPESARTVVSHNNSNCPPHSSLFLTLLDSMLFYIL